MGPVARAPAQVDTGDGRSPDSSANQRAGIASRENLVRRHLAVLLVLVFATQACGPSPDDDAVAICDHAERGRQAIVDLTARVPATDDFEVVSGLLMEIADVTEFLQDWTYVATDELNQPVRTSARAALANTGMYADGSNPITGTELTSNLQSATRHWDDLQRACTQLASG